MQVQYGKLAALAEDETSKEKEKDALATLSAKAVQRTRPLTPPSDAVFRRCIALLGESTVAASPPDLIDKPSLQESVGRRWRIKCRNALLLVCGGQR